jgi:hypothetical protein
MLRAASVVVVGVVDRMDSVGQPVRASDDRGYDGKWQLLKVAFTAENVLKGNLDSPRDQFYFYTSLGPVTGDWNALQPGDRCVFFLKSESKVLRSVRDFWRSSIEIGSGRHESLPLQDRTPQEIIAALLLTPGEGLNETIFERRLPQAVQLAVEWLGICKTVELLRAALRNPEIRLSNAVSRQIAVLPGRAECTERNRGNAGSDEPRE